MSVTVSRTVIDLSSAGARGQPSPPSSYVVVTQTDGNGNNLVVTPTTPLPNDTGENITFRLRPPNKGPGPVLLQVVGVNDGDPWYLLGPGGDPQADQIGDGVYTSDDDLEFERKPGGSVWVVRRVINPTLAKLASSAAGSAYDTRRTFYTARNIQIAAVR